MIAVIGLQSGSLTVAHELGHIFGLFHTFTGITEQTCSSGCYETPANSNLDTYGDFCSDTAVIPINFVCSTPLTGTTEPCGSRTTWTNPYTNVMSYGNCRTGFSPLQMNRLRCYQQLNTLTWLTAVPWKNGVAPAPQTSLAPGTSNPGGPGIASSAILSFFTLLVILITFVFFN